MAAVIGAPGIEDVEHFLRHESRKVVAHESLGLCSIGGILGAIAALVRDDELHVPAPAQCPVALEAVNRGQVVRFLTEAVLVKISNWRVDDRRRIEPIQ